MLIVAAACVLPISVPVAAAQVGDAPASEAAAMPPSAGSVDPPEAVQAQYRDVVARAVSEFGARRWAEARALFLQAHAMWPSARTFRTLGMTSFELRSYARALQELQAALDDPRRPLPDDQRHQVSQLLDQTRAFVGTYRVRLVPAGASLLVDGAPRALGQDGVLLLEVGSHELIARAPGHTESRRRLDVQGHEDEQLVIELTAQQEAASAPVAAPIPAPALSVQASEEPAPKGHRLWTWVAAGSAVALGGATAVLWAVSKSNFKSKKEYCGAQVGTKNACTPSNTDTSGITTPQYVGDVTLGLGIAAAVGAIALFFVEGGSQETAHVSVGPGAVQLRGTF